jgi:hypothetical protein
MADNFTITAEVQHTLNELEVERKKISSGKTTAWGSILLGVLSFFIASSFDQLIIGIIVGGIGGIFGGIKLYQLEDDIQYFKARFKMEVIGAVLSSIDQSLTIDPHSGILESTFRNSQLFTTDPDRYATEDLISGRADKTAFSFAEVHAEYKTEVATKNGTRTVWNDIFKGIIFVADFNKNFNGLTAVRPKDIGSQIGAWFSKHIYSFGDKNVIELENEYFNKNFVTYSTDPVEARYILTPSLMEKIAALNEQSAYCVSLSFTESNMYIAFPLGHNYFEPPIFKTLLKSDLLDADLLMLRFMYDIVSELDLNTRIWTKA